MVTTNKDLVWDLTQVGFLGAFGEYPEEALQVFEGLNAVYTDNLGVKNGLGMCFLFSGKFQEAIEVFRKDVLISDPHNYEARCFLGMALWETGEKEEAKSLVEDALKNGNEELKVISQSCLDSMV